MIDGGVGDAPVKRANDRAMRGFSRASAFVWAWIERRSMRGEGLSVEAEEVFMCCIL